ncbi:plastocyanin/azurin family copper-binding protein [Hyphomicrobium sp.]|uniref:plastocyanin/azurin family copper-binding protein n=1 Tax=Hyphomicrobium sp. TaxID=82 RepID=UPI001DBE22C0|nr:plastocyanin/azurin family copper-binding protein [Hyphomicrobium sp.]MBY0561666.1 cupredoxin domain-containing protein [Hyphomicrobium sp.]
MLFVGRRAALIVLAQALAVAAPAGEIVQVKISDLAFVPAEITVNVGDTVEWVNEDFIDHTATAKSGEWDVMVPAGKSGQVQLDHAATITYFCRVHPGMTGTIRVSAKR